MYLRSAVITSVAELEALRPEWEALLARSASDEPMLSPIWLLAWWRTFGGLDGRRLAVVTLREGDRLPPVDGFWSLTVYGEDLYFVPNEIDRYSLSGDSPDLVRTEDGSIRVELSPDRPADETVNWLPTPDGPFTLLLRLYLPQQAILDGDWEYPEIGIST